MNHLEAKIIKLIVFLGSNKAVTFAFNGHQCFWNNSRRPAIPHFQGSENSERN